jgi:hypothetical protein
MGQNIRAFPPTNLDAAFEYLALRPAARGPVLSGVARLKVKLAGLSLEAVERAKIVPGGVAVEAFVVAEPVAALRQRLAKAESGRAR